MEGFGWALAGGALIGLAATVLLAFNGRVAGISGIAGGLLLPRPGEVGWRVAFLAGLLLGGGGLWRAWPERFGEPAAGLGNVGLLALGGLLVGFGTRLGNGCTSGHGVCGLSRGSVRSLVATGVFMFTGALAVFVLARLSGRG